MNATFALNVNMNMNMNNEYEYEYIVELHRCNECNSEYLNEYIRIFMLL